MFKALITLALAILPSIFAIPTITAVGSRFFTSDGDQWFIKGQFSPIYVLGPSLTKAPGVAYQLSEKDPLLNTEQCTRDANLMKAIGTNVIRVYHVDAGISHDGCMKAFADAGIYLFVDLDTFNSYILGVSRSDSRKN